MSKKKNGARLILVRLEDQKFKYTLRFGFLALNNKSEYKALIQGIELALEIGAKKLVAHSDLQLVVELVN